MQKIEKVLIAGAGAVGLMAAEAIYRYDPGALAILAGGDRLRRYRENGLWVNGGRLDFVFADPALENPAPFDLIIVACKNHQLPQVIADMKNFVGRETIILSLLNGISSEQIIGAAYGLWRLPLAMIIGTDSQNTGNGAAFTQRGIINFGDGEGKDTGRDRLIAAFLTQAALPFEYHPAGMRRAQWYKFMINVGLNQVSALLMIPYGPFKRDSPTGIREVLELTESAMEEAIAVANAEGVDLGAGDIEKFYQSTAKLDDRGFTSMCQDVRARRKTEVELFGLTVMDYGKKHRIPTPVNEVLYRAIRVIEQNYCKDV
ncbi:MAG: ketopantoate reductase family protein [Treponema sp.]|jgi:2-dehydropantoate 2-reductase|nr:ketopantoate reductase family protein [Treponema sp.]